jgi:hypothetical protein
MPARAISPAARRGRVCARRGQRDEPADRDREADPHGDARALAARDRPADHRRLHRAEQDHAGASASRHSSELAANATKAPAVRIGMRNARRRYAGHQRLSQSRSAS